MHNGTRSLGVLRTAVTVSLLAVSLIATTDAVLAGCCQLSSNVCTTTSGATECIAVGGTFHGGLACRSNTVCKGPAGPGEAPALGEWGTMALAGLVVIGAIGLMIRRSKQSAGQEPGDGGPG